MLPPIQQRLEFRANPSNCESHRGRPASLLKQTRASQREAPASSGTRSPCGHGGVHIAPIKVFNLPQTGGTSKPPVFLLLLLMTGGRTPMTNQRGGHWQGSKEGDKTNVSQ